MAADAGTGERTETDSDASLTGLEATEDPEASVPEAESLDDFDSGADADDSPATEDDRDADFAATGDFTGDFTARELGAATGFAPTEGDGTTIGFFGLAGFEGAGCFEEADAEDSEGGFASGLGSGQALLK